MEEIKTLVLPIAGKGKRTKKLAPRTPKGLIRLGGKPIIEYMLADAVEMGTRRVILVVSPENRARFTHYVRVRASLRFPSLSFLFAQQDIPLGDGHAVLQASQLIGHVPFMVRFCDDLLYGEPHPLRQMLAVYKQENANVLLLQKVQKRDWCRYGMIGGKKIAGYDTPTYHITEVVEKPAIADSPSDLMIIGAYILLPDCLRDLQRLAKNKLLAGYDALRLADLFRYQLKHGKKLFGVVLKGKRLDCGTVEGFSDASKFISTKNKRQPGNR